MTEIPTDEELTAEHFPLTAHPPEGKVYHCPRCGQEVEAVSLDSIDAITATTHPCHHDIWPHEFDPSNLETATPEE